MLPNTISMEESSITSVERAAIINVPYREAIGALMYLSVRTRPDIAVAVCTLAKHVQEPRPIHWEAVKRILRYLKGTQNEGLVFQPSNKQRTPTFKLTVNVDADRGTDT
jgi:hypothetical protein